MDILGDKEEADGNEIFNSEKIASNLKNKIAQKVAQEQIQVLLFGEKLSWQSIIYDLINTEQLDPWDIDISLLANKYLEKIKELEEENFFVSSKVLLAASLLLRMKSEILLNHHLPVLDEILFGKKEESKRYIQERIELDEDIPHLIARTPLPRFKKVSLDELMSALGHAINTENRRIKKIVLAKQQEYETGISLPKHRINIKDKIHEIYSRLTEIFSSRENKISLSEFAGSNNKDKITTFVPLLHLDTQHKVWLEQEAPFDEIWIILKSIYEKQNAEMLRKMKEEAEREIKNLMDSMTEEEKERAEKIESDFENPIGLPE